MTRLRRAPQVGSALIIEIPEAEPGVAEPRSRLDRSAALGVPAHVTALFPFVTPDDIDDAVLRRVSDAAAAVAPFDYRFARTGWFGQQVVYLAPDQPTPFREVTERLWAVFPDCPPYGGQFEQLVPHLTIGEGAAVEQLRDAEYLVRSRGPVVGRARALTLLVQGKAGLWTRSGVWALGTGAGFRRV